MKNMKLYKKALLILSLGLTLNSCLDLDPQLISMVGPVISSLLFLMVHILTGVRT